MTSKHGQSCLTDKSKIDFTVNALKVRRESSYEGQALEANPEAESCTAMLMKPVRL